MAIFDQIAKEFHCECGCGTVINPWSTWTHGHWPRSEDFREEMSRIRTGLTYSRDHCQNISEGLLKVYKELFYS